MKDMNMLNEVKFVVDQQGKPAAVQISIEAWESLLAYLEDIEDRKLVKASLAKLSKGPLESGAIRWDDIRSEWDTNNLFFT